MSDVVSRLLAAIDETANHGPSADLVLRLCQSHRDIVAEWQKYRGTCSTERQLGYFAGLDVSVRALVRGYGIEDGQTK